MVALSAAGRGVGRALAIRALEVAAEDGYLAMLVGLYIMDRPL